MSATDVDTRRYGWGMRTVVLGDRPRELDELIERRRATGADRYDEVWKGEYHMAPAPRHGHALVDNAIAVLLTPAAAAAGLFGSGPFNFGEPGDYRVPDRGFHRSRSNDAWLATAAIVVEIVSPDDETWEKLPFYAARDVDEVVIIDPSRRAVTWMERDDRRFRQVERSTLLGVDVGDLADHIDWPPAD